MLISVTFRFLLVVLVTALSGGAAAQAVPSSSRSDSTSTTSDRQSKTGEQKQSEEQKQHEQTIEKKEQSQRVLGVIPQFGTTSRHNAPPLTSAQKFHLFAKSAFDPVELSVVGLQAGLSQAEDEFPEYGQGATGFGKRYGATLADEVSSGFFTNYFYPVLFKEDPRYFRLGEGTIRHRLIYSLKQELICHTDTGARSFSWENVMGALSGGGLSNAYYPQAERGFGLTMSRGAIAIGYGSLGGLVDEFYPDISHRLFHRHQSQTRAQP